MQVIFKVDCEIFEVPHIFWPKQPFNGIKRDD